ncbi:MAG: hypothetical protein P4L92_17125 [Rudaea sp.]|nr:hypothetical protein [Rudaea sp.]
MAVREEFRLPRWPIVIVAIASAAGTASLVSPSTASSVVPSGCTSIQDVPPLYNGIEYGAAIQGLFDNFLTNGGMAGCADCHTNPASGAAGNLDLTDGDSWGDLVNIASNEDPGIMYVVPNHPEQSLLFQKINCANPAVGAQMPYEFPPGTLSPEQQALIYDWIAEGATVGTTDGIFRNGFDIRGFDQ